MGCHKLSVALLQILEGAKCGFVGERLGKEFVGEGLDGIFVADEFLGDGGGALLSGILVEE